MLSCKVLAQCLLAASLQHQVPAEALLAIMEVEGGRSGLEVKNSNGTADLGLCQINTCWLGEASRLWSVTPLQAKTLLRDQDCLNIAMAARILRIKIREGGGDLRQGIARYHHAHPRYGQPYLKNVLRAWQRQRRKTLERQQRKKSFPSLTAVALNPHKQEKTR